MPSNTRTRSSSRHLENSISEQYPNLSADGKILATIMQTEFAKLREEMSTKDGEIVELREKVTCLDKTVAKLRELIDDNDSYDRRDTIVLSGKAIPVFNVGENSTNIARDVIKNVLKIEMSPNDISVSHRFGKKPANQQPDKRDIIVKLCRRDLKRPLITASKELSPQQRPNLYVNEHLTPTRKTLLFALRQMKRAHPDLVKGCSSFEGRIYAYTKPPVGSPAIARDRRHLVNTREALVEFCREYVNKPITAFLENWSH